MCGVPFHAVDGYIARLVKKGFRVAICDQVEDPRKAKGLVKREVVRVVSPGTLTDANYLDAREPAFLMARRAAATATTARRRAARSLHRRVQRRRIRRRRRPAGARRRARRAQAARDHRARRRQRRAGAGAARRSPRPGCRSRRSTAGRSSSSAARRTLLDQLRAGGLEGFGLDGHPAAVAAAGALVHYLRDTQKVDLAHVRVDRLPRSAPTRCSSIRRRSSTSRSSRASEGGRDGLAARRARSHGDVDGQPAAARRGCCGRWSRSSRSAIASTPSRSSPSAPPSAASSATRSRRCRISSGWSRAPRSAPPGRAISSA